MDVRRGFAVRAGLLVVALVAAAGSGCATTRLADLRPAPHNPLAETFQLKSWSGPKPSERTMLVLRRVSLDERVWRRIDTKPEEILSGLTQAYDSDPQMETLYALAEINYIAAARKEDRDERLSIRYYLQAVERCYQYLFDPQFDSLRNPYDPQFRGACDLYNSSLERCLRFARRDGLFKAGGKVSFASVGSRLSLQVVPKGFAWKPEAFHEFEFVSDYQLKGVPNRYQTHGLGVPLIAIRRTGSAPRDQERYYARNLSFPVTAFLRLNKWEKEGEPASGTINGQLELYDPLESTDVPVAGLRVPLESDITTPLAWFLDMPGVRKLDALGLTRVDKARKFAGLYMVQPYQPGKIPVLMVHGLYSSPMTWLEAFNDLRADPELRERYQFWFYLYPTGQPFWQSAADLRGHLAAAGETFSHDGGRPMANMVLVGHSMGGLISRMVTQESGDRYWHAVSRTPFAQVKGDQDSVREIERVYFFEPVPEIARVVTLGSPFRGSDYSNDFTRRVARGIISFPQRTMETTGRLLTMNPDLFRDSHAASTSIDSLSPDSPVLRVLAESPGAPGVRYHNVVGITKKDVPLEQNTDGVVAYASAHRTDVESEKVIRADHVHVHRHPLAVDELRRILKVHLTELRDRNPRAVTPVGDESLSSPGSNRSARSSRPSTSTDSTGQRPAFDDFDPDTEDADPLPGKASPWRAAPGAGSIYHDGAGLNDWRPARRADDE